MTERGSILADEHVPRAVIRNLQSNGFDIVAAAHHHNGVDDRELLEIARTQNRIILTNDRDFVSLATNHSHPGILLYTTATPEPATVARALRRIDRLFDADELANELLWLSDWG